MNVGDRVGKAGIITARYGSAGHERAHVRLDSGVTVSARLDALELLENKPKCAPGSKYDDAKPDWSLVQWRALDKYVRVLTFGATKYDRDNWQKVPNLRHRYLAAALRHVAAYATGEGKDPESGEHHLAHAICCLAFVLEDILTNEKEPQP